MPRVIVTGGSGKLGSMTVKVLAEAGWDVVNADIAPPKEQTCPFALVDLENYGEVYEMLAGYDVTPKKADAVVHLAAIPAHGKAANSRTFRVNTMATYNVFEACRRLQIRNIVWASSETLLGLPFHKDPQKVPLDETIVCPESSYSLSKEIGEVLARRYAVWDPETKIIGLRFSNVLHGDDYKAFPGFEKDIRSRIWNLWAYIDTRDAGEAILAALNYDKKGADVFNISANDTVMEKTTNAELMQKAFPNVKYNAPSDPYETLMTSQRAKDLLGWEPKRSWRTTKD